MDFRLNSMPNEKKKKFISYFFSEKQSFAKQNYSVNNNGRSIIVLSLIVEGFVYNVVLSIRR